MRKKMHHFIDDEEVQNLTFFANPALFAGDLDDFNTLMHEYADEIPLDFEMEYLMGSEMGVHFLAHQTKHIGDMIVDVNKTSLSQSNEVNQEFQKDYMIWEFCDILEMKQRNIKEKEGDILYLEGSREGRQKNEMTSNVSNYSVSNSLDEMYARLLCRLIDTVKYSFLILARHRFKNIRAKAQISQNFFKGMEDLNRAPNWKADRACAMEEFLRKAKLESPELLRVIDIEATCEQGLDHVVIIDYWANDGALQVGYTAISHTFGMDVYDVFNCRCASEYSGAHPRCWDKPCPHVATQHHDASPGSLKHKGVVDDILKMCAILKKAGVRYAWHDGVCIAQYDKEEVKQTILHIGWIYSKAKETLVFLHYVGNPMAPIKNSINNVEELCSRWHNRVWTIQEAVLSERRRYCVRVGTSPLGDCKSLEEFEEKIALWYGHNTSTIEILEEESFFELVKDIHKVLISLLVMYAQKISTLGDADDDVKVQINWMWQKATENWLTCIWSLLHTMHQLCFQFPTPEATLQQCCGRDSKHKGDRMNSILSLAEVKGFVADKDEKLEASTIEFFKKQGQVGLARAVFSSYRNIRIAHKEYMEKERKHTWPIVLWIDNLVNGDTRCSPNRNPIEFEVLEDGRMELRSKDFYWMIWVPVKFTYKNAGMVEPPVDMSINHDVWDMELSDFDGSGAFKAKLFSACVGEIYIGAIQGCNGETSVAWEIMIGHGDSTFDANLVMVFDSISNPILIVQGSLQDAHVSKVGLFEPSNAELQFWQLLQANLPPSSTFLKKLILL